MDLLKKSGAMSSDGGIPQKAYDSRTTVPYSDNSWMNRLNNALIPILTPENIDAFRESCPVQVAVHGVMGRLPLFMV